MSSRKLTKSAKPKMADLAARISEHLKRFEADREGANREISRDRDTPAGKGLRRYFNAGCLYVGTGSRLHVRYVSYQGNTTITRDEAERYLAKLDAGFVGRHFEALRERKS